MRVLFLDIDGVTVDASIQRYVGQISLFSDDTIKDFEYIKKCINFMLEKAKSDGASLETISLIERVYKYVSHDMFEMLKEHRDCFLEFDNLTTSEEKQKYIENYISNPVVSSNNAEISMYMNYIIASLIYAHNLIQTEYDRVKHDGGKIKLPFETVNLDNDIISYDESEDPLRRSLSALDRMRDYARNHEQGKDSFIIACLECMDKKIVDYDEIYTAKNLMPGVYQGLRYLLENKEVNLIIACSHFTGEREAMAKFRLFKGELPFVLIMNESLIKFHTDPAQMGKRRERSSKNMRIDEILEKISQAYLIDEKEIGAMLIDDSMPNLEGLLNKTSILFRRQKEYESPLSTGIFRLVNWDLEKVIELFSRIRLHQDRVKSKGDSPKILIKQ